MISIVLPIHDKQNLVEASLRGIFHNSSSLVKEIILVFDGCTDRSEEIANDLISRTNPRPRDITIKILHTPDLWEVKACNAGYRMATQPFIINFQDDMVVNELGYDIRLIKPALVWPEVFAVTSLAACDIVLEAGHIQWSGLTNFHNSTRNTFSIRDTINRGPLLLRHSMLEELDYLDEIYAPLHMDDIDISFRAWQHGWVVGVYPMTAFFKVEDGTTRNNPKSAAISQTAWNKNEKILIERHRDLIIGSKHSENRLLEA